MDSRLERILPLVQKPARYSGGEYGQTIKNKSEVTTRVAFCFPDTYEIGMSNLGMKILCAAANEMPGVWCERVFAPWGDMEEQLRKNSIPLCALESGDSIRDFDIVAFSLGYEMAYTNVLNMLDLAGLPVRAAGRGEDMPIVVAGGACAYNPEPLADFVDAFLIGEGEESFPEFIELCGKMRGRPKRELLAAAAKLPGCYVPSMYSVAYLPDGRVESITPLPGAPKVVTKRIVKDFENSIYPIKTPIPSTEIVHDRTALELFRGCVRGCRFCQAGYTYRPVRTRSPEKLIEQGKAALEFSGYQEVGLLSLSSSDYRGLGKLADGLLEWCEPRKISLSLPSLRADNFSMEVMEKIQKTRKTGLTFAPEAGSQRLRDAINKNLTEEEILSACTTAFAGGRNSVKLYFMLGLPTETDEDIVAIAELAFKIVALWKRHGDKRAGGPRITLSTACFVPKPLTPFQWEAQDTAEEFERKIKLLRDSMRTRAVTYNWHDSDTSVLEAALARGDRRMGGVIERAWRSGCRMDSWSEYFSYEKWRQAFADEGLDMAFYAGRLRDKSEVLPWSHISAGVDADYLWAVREAAYRSEITPDCRASCTGCGADRLLEGGKCDE